VDRTALRTICLRISYAISLSLSLKCCTCTNIQKQTRATHQLQSRINLSLTYVVSSVVHAHNSLHTTSLLRARAKSGSSLTIHMGLSRRWQGRDEPHHHVTTTTTAPAAVAGETEGERWKGCWPVPVAYRGPVSLPAVGEGRTGISPCCLRRLGRSTWRRLLGIGEEDREQSRSRDRSRSRSSRRDEQGAG